MSAVREHAPEHWARVNEAYNICAAEACAGHAERLIPVTILRNLEDVDWSVRELRRMQERGSRAFQIPLNPVGGCGLADPRYDALLARGA